MGEGKESARAQVLAARALLDEELVRLEASARAAVDVKAKVRRNPVKAAGVAAGTGFLLVGGPAKVLRGARNAIFGKPDPMPKSMLPKEIDASLKKLGGDGARMRGTIERDFARYLEEKAPERRSRDLGAMLAAVIGTAGMPIALRAGRQLAERMLNPDSAAFTEQMQKIRARRAEKDGGPKTGA